MAEEETQSSENSEEQNTSGVTKILIVDDEEDLTQVITSYLTTKKPDFLIFSAGNGQKGIAIVEENGPFDLIVSDLKMPEMNGLTFTKEVVTRWPGTSIILMSAFLNNVESLETLKLGVDKVIEKPVRLQQLVAAIEEVLAERENKEVISFIPVRTEQILEGDKYIFDIYIRLRKKKFIKIFNKSDITQPERLEKYSAKGCDTLYIEKKDYLTLEERLFFPITSKTLMIDKEIGCDIYSTAKDEFKKIIKRGTMITKQHMDVLSKYDVKQLFIDDFSEEEYKEYLEKAVDPLLEDENIGVKERTEILADHSTNVLEDTFGKVTTESINKVNALSENLQNFMKNTSGMGLKSIMNLNKKNSVYHHCLNVSCLSVALVNEIFAMRKTTKTQKMVKAFDRILDDTKNTREIISTAGLLHEIGMVVSGINCGIDLKELPPEQQRAFFNHPNKAYDILSKSPEVHDKVAEVVLQHEEFCDGSGFPNNIFKKDMNIYAQIISLVNFFDTHVTKERMSTKNAWKEVRLNGSKFNQYLVPIFEKIIT
jgi:response regulator RpfG family c-di-GMP phosphodiesterase